MFTTIVEEYDIINRIVTFGLDDVWRKHCAANCTHCKVIVDLCCGTGRLLKQISQYTGFESLIVGLDFSRAMLKKAICNNHKDGEERRVNMQAPKDGIEFILADAGYLPLKDESVDCVCISFSLRNLIYKNPQAKVHLKEIIRALKPGGKFVCVETSQPKWLPSKMLYHIYLQSTQVYIHIEKAMFRSMEPDEYHVKVAQTKEEIIGLLEQGFEYVMEKEGLAYFRKRK